jgi:hypothetical protein
MCHLKTFAKASTGTKIAIPYPHAIARPPMPSFLEPLRVTPAIVPLPSKTRSIVPNPSAIYFVIHETSMIISFLF